MITANMFDEFCLIRLSMSDVFRFSTLYHSSAICFLSQDAISELFVSLKIVQRKPDVKRTNQ